MASIYEKTPLFKSQKTWSDKTPLGDLYKLCSNDARNNKKAEIHKDSGQFGIEFTLDKTINDFICGTSKVQIMACIVFVVSTDVQCQFLFGGPKQVAIFPFIP